MAILTSPTASLRLLGMLDRGKPNKERIYIKVEQPTNLRYWALAKCVVPAPEMNIPLPNYFLWLGYENVEPPYMIVVYTGPGERKMTMLADNITPALALHWGQPYTMFNDERHQPALFSFFDFLLPEVPTT